MKQAFYAAHKAANAQTYRDISPGPFIYISAVALFPIMLHSWKEEITERTRRLLTS